MARLWCAVAVILGFLIPLACQRSSEPPPPMLDDAAAGLPAVRIPRRVRDRSILGQAAAGPTPPSARGETGEEAVDSGIRIDQSSAEGIFNTLAAMREPRDSSLLPKIVIPEQRLIVGERAKAMQPLADALKDIERASKEKFPDTPLDVPVVPGSVLPAAGTVTVAEVRGISDDEAQATLEWGGAGGSQAFTARRVDGVWYVVLPNMPPPDQLGMAKLTFAVFAVAAKQLQGVQAQIENGEFIDATAAQDAIRNALIAGRGGGPPPPADTPGSATDKQPEPSGDEPPRDAEPAKPKARGERPRDEVDDAYVGPGQLRAR